MPREPPRWRETLRAIEKMRAARDAPVDTMGCTMLADRSASPPVRRFQTLAALVLSPQTKDAVTAAAMARLHARCAPLDAQSVAAMDVDALAAILCPVGFYRRKAAALVEIARLCARDIPDTVDGLVALPGVGPKIAHLAMQCAWGRVEGIGVDVHVDRISRRLGWAGPLYHQGSVHDERKRGGGAKNTAGGKKRPRALSGPEQTRMDLEDWMPREHWQSVNVLLVGFGQTVCLPRNPKCESCLLRSTCPSSTFTP